jgi:putative endonuclease
MCYTKVLRWSDGDFYVGSTINLRDRFAQHEAGRVPATADRGPVILEYCEACRFEANANRPEKALKTGLGRAYLKRRLAS